jgi:PAS domain S-box-containing protein
MRRRRESVHWRNALETNRLSSSSANANSTFQIAIFVSLVLSLCYIAARLGGALVLQPQRIWPLWPGCAVLVALLLLMPRKLWPLLIAAGLAGFVLYDAQAGVPSRSTGLLILSDALEVLIAAYGVSFFFEGIPSLNSVKALARYVLFAVLLAPISVASIGATALGGSYWGSWKVSFLTEALALLTVTPAILGWVQWVRTGRLRSRSHAVEITLLLVGLAFWAFITFAAFPTSGQPELLYTLLPFLLWAALRFGITGVSTAMVVVALLSIWGAIHGRGPFTGYEPLKVVWSLQLFLLFASATFMVLAAVVEEQKRAAASMLEGEARFRLVCNTAPVMIWMSGADQAFSYFNQTWLDFTGRPIDEELGNGWTQAIHPEDLQSFIQTYITAFDGRRSFKMQCRVRRHDGEYRWISGTGVPRFDDGGSFAGYIGSCTDFTDNRLAEQALASVSQRLILAQEKERTRIARELHDDINQRIALIAIDLMRLGQTSDSLANVSGQIVKLKDRMAELGTEVQTISHRLHSSKLEYLGLVAAAASFCRELSSQHEVKIDFSHEEVPSVLPVETSLCLFRVLQESLTNGVKHSGAQTFKVDLRRNAETLNLTVSDSGVGFDPKVAIANKGIGLVSMQERLHLVNGAFSIDSSLARGTTIRASVPITSSGNPSQIAV